MRTYPPQANNLSAYRAAMARVVANPFAQRVTEIMWHGTEDYQRFIERDGLESQQQLLRTIRIETARMQEQMPTLAAAIAEGETRSAELRDDVADAGSSQDFRIARRQSLLYQKAIDTEAQVAKDRVTLRAMKQALPTYREAAERLESALVVFVTAPAKREEALPPPPAPVVHVTVETPPPAEPAGPIPVVVTAMPDRIRKSEVAYGANGDIAGVTQIEKDV